MNTSTETAADCLKVLQDYIPNEFKSLSEEDIEVKVQQGGLVNTLKLITKKRDNYRVLIREFGGNLLDSELFRSLRSPLSWQLLLFHELSNLGIGPKLLGVFESGRIEEFIPSHTLIPEEFNDEEILKDLAINTARIHVIKLAISNQQKDMDQFMGIMFGNFVKNYTPDSYTEKYRTRLIDCDADLQLFKTIAEVDWTTELSDIKSITERFETRTGLLVWDNNFRNVLIREDPKPGQLKTCIIDYECCRYGNPVDEIGSRFVNQLLDFGAEGKEKATGYKILEESKRRFFIREYLKERKRQEGDETIDFQESSGQQLEEEVDQWMFECDHSILRNMINFILVPFVMELFLERDIAFVFLSITCYKNYLEWKSYLKTSYGSFS